MSEKVRITSFDIENVKKVKAVALTPTQEGLTVIGGENGEGKTSILEAIMGALGGDNYRQQVRNGASKGTISIELSNGLVVKRTYTAKGGSRLEVVDPEGKKGGQQLLNEFISPFALSVGSFMEVNDKKRTEILLEVSGVNLTPFEERIKDIEQERLLKGRERDSAKGYAETLEYRPEIGETKKSASDISQQLEEVYDHNLKIASAVKDVSFLEGQVIHYKEQEKKASEALARAELQLGEMRKALGQAENSLAEAVAHRARLGEERNTAALQEEFSQIEEHNKLVERNIEKKKADQFARKLSEEYAELNQEIADEKAALRSLLEKSSLPYPGLSVTDGELTYNGHPWASLSESERLILSTAVARAIKPGCGFVLIDGLERMSCRTLEEFAVWLREQGLQAIGTRVGTDAPGTIIIEDGEITKENK